MTGVGDTVGIYLENSSAYREIDRLINEYKKGGKVMRASVSTTAFQIFHIFFRTPSPTNNFIYYNQVTNTQLV